MRDVSELKPTFHVCESPFQRSVTSATASLKNDPRKSSERAGDE